jgi:hypothetical protein
MLASFTRYRYALAWSGLVFLSYSAYQTDAYLENYWLITIEYVVVIAVFAKELLPNKAIRERL